MKRIAVCALLFVCSIAGADNRRRAVTQPSWLSEHAHPLATTEAVGDLDDLDPLRDMIGTAAIVTLADGTHGTHEYFTTKLRSIQFLVSRMGFDTLALEGTFPQMERVNAYVQGEPVDIRTAIFPLEGETDYHFWAVEEFVAVADWMRSYNLTRADKPRISIVGIDVWDGGPASAAFDASDPAQRNHGMAVNAQWALQHRSVSGRMILWGHGEHFGKTLGVENVKNAGMWLAEMFGDDYFVIGNAMWDGVYLGLNGTTQSSPEMMIPVVPASADSYEVFFRTARRPVFLLSLNGQLDPFLMQPHFLRTAGFSVSNNWNFRMDLRKKFDAIVYVELTTPTHPLPR